MKKHIVCLGDSNTHGYCADPAGCADSGLARFNENERWTCLLQKALGEEYLVIEEGLCGRTTVFDDPVEILEVKYDEFLPSYIQSILSGITAQRSAVSKYTWCRRYENKEF